MLFPAAMSGKEKREKMAIMETAISSSLSHPNIVQTYTYVVKPLTGELALKVRQHISSSSKYVWPGDCGWQELLACCVLVGPAQGMQQSLSRLL